jgi:hypothetical protein
MSKGVYQIPVRIPMEKGLEIKKMAQNEPETYRSMNQFIEQAIAEKLAREKEKKA